MLGSLYGSHPIVFLIKQTALIQSNTIHVYFNSVGYTYMYATCFGLYTGHPQAFQYKNFIREDTTECKWSIFTVAVFIILKYKLYSMKV